MDNDRIYYVYEWIRLDTNESFYVGKGKEDRAYRKKRGNNNHFNNIVKSIPTAVNFLKTDLLEKEALEWEIYYIDYYKNDIGFDLVNITDGGEGVSGLKHSESNKKKYSLMFTGIDIEKEKDNIIDLYINKNMSTIEIGNVYGISKTTVIRYLNKWDISIRNNSESKKGKCSGEDSVHYGKKHSEERRKKNSNGHKGIGIGSKNPASICVELYDENLNLVKKFETQKECAEYMVDIKISKSTKGAIDRIQNSIKTNNPYKGYYFVKHSNKQINKSA